MSSNYPGNPSLAAPVKERVNSTYNQTVELYRQGRTDEVVSGCNLILQMDPLFDPAKKLLEKVRNPTSSFEVDFSGIGGSVAGGSSLDDARSAMQARDFERVIQITTEILTNDLMNDDARVLADEAREKIEAGPFIDQFVRKCEQNVNNGNLAAARADLEKARALDASHPGVRRIEQMIASKEAAAPAAATSSFVVDTPSTGGRSTAQASDFGFTFEEDKNAGGQPPAAGGFANFSFDTPAAPGKDSPFGGGFSFDTPAAPPPATAPAAAPSFSFDAPTKGPGNEFDFSTASIETSPDDQKKIEQYLADGDKAFDSGNYQQAIDLWSRIFLIDVTNEPASERIERAKAKRRESEQKIETILAAGVQAFERKDVATARAKLNEVLQLDPNNVTAQDYIERLDASGGAAAPAFAPSTSETYTEPSVLEDESMGDVYQEPVEEVAAAPAPRRAAAARPAARRAAIPAAASSSKAMGLIIAVLAAIIVIGGGYFAWSKFMSTPKTDPAAAQALLGKASDLSAQGKYDLAIATLQDIKPGDPQYDKALVMIADLQQKKARASALVEGRPAASYYDENLAAGRAAFSTHDYVSAKKAFEQAQRVKPLPMDAKASYDVASQQVAKLDNARTLFAERKYQDVINSLEPILQQDPQNKNVQRMIIDSHFNLGATALQDERLPEAKKEFESVLQADPNDELARRSKDLAERYDGQPKDLLYRIYVKYLPLRQPAA